MIKNEKRKIQNILFNLIHDKIPIPAISLKDKFSIAKTIYQQETNKLVPYPLSEYRQECLGFCRFFQDYKPDPIQLTKIKNKVFSSVSHN